MLKVGRYINIYIYKFYILRSCVKMKKKITVLVFDECKMFLIKANNI